MLRKTVLIAAALAASPALAAEHQSSTLCRQGDAVFRLAVETGVSGQSCETRSSMDGGPGDVIWRSFGDTGLCQRKADTLAAMLSDHGWTCSPRSPIEIASRS